MEIFLIIMYLDSTEMQMTISLMVKNRTIVEVNLISMKLMNE